MELERGQIQKRDFSQARKGYDPDEVDRHLRAVAEAVEKLKSAPPQATLAGAAAARVEAIVAAAEVSAREIEDKARADATAQVAEAKDAVDGLVAQAATLQARMDEIAAALGEAKMAVDAMAAETKALAAQPSEPAAPEPAATEPEPKPEPEPAEPEPEPEPEPAAAAPARKGDGGGSAGEGARLIALNMALSGTPREETARYLRENFDLDDEDGLLDDVYARVGS